MKRWNDLYRRVAMRNARMCVYAIIVQAIWKEIVSYVPSYLTGFVCIQELNELVPRVFSVIYIPVLLLDSMTLGAGYGFMCFSGNGIKR